MAFQRLTPRSPRLPLELIDLVADHLYDDKTSLLSISLVSRQWISSAQYHLFSSVCINMDPSKPRGRYHRFPPASPKEHSCFPAFIELLLSAPHLCTYIKELEVICTHDAGSKVCSRGFRHVAIDLDTNSEFVQILNLLGALHTLSLNDVVLSLPDSEHIAGPHPSLRHLVLKYTGINIPGLAALLSVCSPKGSLGLVYTSVSSGRDGPSAYQLSVEELSIQAESYDLFDGCFDGWSSLEFPNLIELTIDTGNHIKEAMNGDDTQDFFLFTGEFLTKNGSRLQHLRLDLAYLEPWEMIFYEPSWAPFHLSSVCPVLQSLHLGFASYHNESDDEGFWQSTGAADIVIRILSLAPKTLRSVVFAISMFSESFVLPKHGHWQTLSDILETFPDLTDVTFGQPGFDQSMLSEVDTFTIPLDRRIQSYFAKEFPGLEKRGILCFE